MPDIELPPPDLLKGFNEGYLLAEHYPDMAKEIAAALPDTTRGNAFKKGYEQFLSEKDKSKDKPERDNTPPLPDWLQKDRSRFDDPDREIDKDLA
jgi:hypothetical protein